MAVGDPAEPSEREVEADLTQDIPPSSFARSLPGWLAHPRRETGWPQLGRLSADVHKVYNHSLSAHFPPHPSLIQRSTPVPVLG